MITIKLSDTIMAFGEPTEMGVFYSTMIASMAVMKPTVEQAVSEREAFAHVLEQLKSLQIRPIDKKEDDPDATNGS